ncbi:pyridoxamine 5'-phosphate oxidase family protein [Rummeliibacillus pycnus]|uniref:pyridoxamine 5'-phosphate oxidase family protein n=1 Tax=Rummeliibacillus pycnus TaxID=101070 RepID=UPI000C9A0D02|nr:pyridoxamine 5'-phosphate oxidase family protein [Rummeliibacillus pycnus]
MSNQDLKEKILNIISKHKLGVLSSVENNKPHSRYMTFYSEGLTLFTPTKMDTEKIEEIEANASVSVLLGYEDKGQDDAYVEISGIASINKSQELKMKLWEESFSQWFKGPEDPNYIFLQIQPEIIRILNTHGESSEELVL